MKAPIAARARALSVLLVPPLLGLAGTSGGGKVALGNPPAGPGEDWLVIVRK